MKLFQLKIFIFDVPPVNFNPRRTVSSFSSLLGSNIGKENIFQEKLQIGRYLRQKLPWTERMTWLLSFFLEKTVKSNLPSYPLNLMFFLTKRRKLWNVFGLLLFWKGCSTAKQTLLLEVGIFMPFLSSADLKLKLKLSQWIYEKKVANFEENLKHFVKVEIEPEGTVEAEIAETSLASFPFWVCIIVFIRSRDYVNQLINLFHVQRPHPTRPPPFDRLCPTLLLISDSHLKDRCDLLGWYDWWQLHHGCCRLPKNLCLYKPKWSLLPFSNSCRIRKLCHGCGHNCRW